MGTTIEALLHRRPDLSTFIVHFTRDYENGRAEDNLLSILTQGCLEARTVFGMAKKLASESKVVADTQRTVCFTETPLEHAWMMTQEIEERRDMKFNGYGLAFTKAFARKHGCNPVWYLDMTEGPARGDWLTKAVNALVDKARKDFWIEEVGDIYTPGLAEEPILKLTPFIEQMGTWPKTGTRKEFWWEREWRCTGGLSFEPSDVVVAFAPQKRHAALRKLLFAHAESLDIPQAQHLRQLADSRIVDSDWSLEYMIGTLAGISDLGPFPSTEPSL